MEMTENEAIMILKGNFPKTCKMVDGRYQGGFDDTECDLGKALSLSISALKEIRKYREIGTVKECMAAVEKQKAREPDIWGDGYDNEGNMVYDMYDCPNCGESYEIEGSNYNHCPNCGQALSLGGIPK